MFFGSAGRGFFFLPGGGGAPPVNPLAPVVTGGTLTGEVGTAITPYPITATTTGSPITAYAAVNLPGGLAVAAPTGVISGTPTEAVSNRAVSIRATNAEGTGRATLRVTIITAGGGGPGPGPTPTPPWDVTATLPGNVVVIDGTTGAGRFPLTSWIGWDPSFAQDVSDDALYLVTPPANPAAQVVRLFATFTPPGTPVEVDFDGFGMGTPATNKLTRWSFDSTPPASILVYGSNSTTQPIQLRLSKA